MKFARESFRNNFKLLFLQIDVQDRYLKLMVNWNNLLKISKLMIKASSFLKIPHLVTEYRPNLFGITPKEIRELYHPYVNIFAKDEFSVYKNSQIKNAIDQINPNCIIVYGCETQICILQSILDLISKGYHVYVLSDGLSSLKKHDLKCGVFRLSQSAVTITTFNSLMYEIENDIKSSRFYFLYELTKENNNM